MDKESNSGAGGLPSNGIVAVVLLVAGVLLVRESPLQTTRLPVSETRLEQHYTRQDVEARLWQDPLAAIARHRTETRKNSPDKLKEEDARRSAQDLAREVKGAAGKGPGRQPQVLAVMLSGGPYSEYVESRRRARYAVLAALNASRLSPTDTEHLGYFVPAPAKGPSTQPPAPIPYEWFEPAGDSRQRELSKDTLQSKVLVMWLQAEAFRDAPLARMAELARPFIDAGASWRVLGPTSSDGLKEMIDEAGAQEFQRDAAHDAIRYYSLYATVSDAVLLGDRPDKKEHLEAVSGFLAKRNINLVRTIGDDARLADALTEELRLRGLEPRVLKPGDNAYRKACATPRLQDAPSSIAVVGEWDTLYGRTLRREFRAKAKEESKGDEAARVKEAEPGFCVENYSYVRGLDGQLPGGGDGATGSGSASKQNAGDKDESRRKDGTFVEIAEGQSQFDYLRRLAVQMRVRDEQLRRTRADGQGFQAIGVLGNDLHDKLLVMQALRPEFPNAIFFTTDMDARLLHPREQAWTRNLIVASNFGLRLADSLQAGSPPFRESYQVSAFLSTRIAMDDARRALQLEKNAGDARLPLAQSKLDEWLKKPRVFEIGRTEAFNFTGTWRTGIERLEPDPSCRGRDWIECGDIHPTGSPRYPAPGLWVMFLVFSVLVFAIWVPPALLCYGVKAGRSRALAEGEKAASAPSKKVMLLALLAIAVQVGLPLAMACGWEAFADWLTRDGKPLVAIEGISPWPTEVLRFFILLICLYLFYRAWLMLTSNLEKIGVSFHAGIAQQALEARQESADRRASWWRMQVQKFSMSFIPPLHRDQPAREDHGMAPEAIDFWGRHIVQNRLNARLLRTVVAAAAAALLSGLLIAAIGEPRFVPQRGSLSIATHDGLRIAALGMMYLLVFFVVDATALCVRFVRGLLRLRRLREFAANWPELTLKKFEQEMGIPRTHLENWIDLQFVARRTQCVTQLIYYPFIVISLWLLSRSPVFDHWTLSVSTVAPALLGAVVALGCAVALRWAAEDSRAHAIEQIKDEICRASARVLPDDTSPPPAPSVEQLKLLQARIEKLEEGAFAPFWQQPLLKALLLPFATLGGSTLLDYMALANL